MIRIAYMSPVAHWKTSAKISRDIETNDMRTDQYQAFYGNIGRIEGLLHAHGAWPCSGGITVTISKGAADVSGSLYFSRESDEKDSRPYRQEIARIAKHLADRYAGAYTVQLTCTQIAFERLADNSLIEMYYK